MRKWSKLLILLLLLIPIKVNALTGNISLNCSPVTASSNTNIICNVKGTSDEEVSAFSTNVSLSSNLEYVSFIPDSIWLGDDTGNKIGLYTSENKIGEFNIGVLTVKVKSNVFDTNETISLINNAYSTGAPDYSKVSLGNASVNIRVPSSNNKLSSLEINPGEINFSSDTLNYNVSVDSSSVSINATKEYDKSTVSGDIGNKDLKYGLNTFKINVTSESGEVRTYTINVTRIDKRSTENRLSSLSISGNKINFNENTDTYNINVDYDTSSVKINANLKNTKSSFVKGYEPGTKSLEEGLNKIELKVKAENGSIKTYTINVTRSEDPDNKSDDTYLESLKVDNGKIDFSKEQEEYKMTVSYETNSINIDAITSSNKSKVEITGNENLQVGENTIIVKVTSLNGDVREYKIIVTKKEFLSNNNYLKILQIAGYEIDFNKDKLTYELNISDEDKLAIVALSEHDGANVKITGNKNLKDKSIIKITVTAEDDTTREYIININKKVKINYLLIVILLETIIIIGVIAYLIIRKRKKDKYEEI